MQRRLAFAAIAACLFALAEFPLAAIAHYGTETGSSAIRHWWIES